MYTSKQQKRQLSRLIDQINQQGGPVKASDLIQGDQAIDLFNRLKKRTPYRNYSRGKIECLYLDDNSPYNSGESLRVIKITDALTGSEIWSTPDRRPKTKS